jgi:CRP/FNR family transcriptional regulator, dissimilatory nitrate respiration regulator
VSTSGWPRRDIEQIGKSALFAALDPALLDQVLTGGEPASYAKGAAICREGEAADICHLVLRGIVKLSRQAGPDAMAVISLHKPGQTFMEGDCFSGGVYSTTAEAVTDCRIARIDAVRLRRLIGDNPALALSLLGSASVQLRMLLHQVERLKLMTATARLAAFILDLARAARATKSVPLPYDKKIIAAQLGITPESFSRTLRQLRSHGVVMKKHDIEIEDLNRLRSLCSAE